MAFHLGVAAMIASSSTAIAEDPARSPPTESRVLLGDESPLCWRMVMEKQTPISRQTATGRGVFVNLWRTARQETDALALVKAVDAAALTPLLRSDGPPVGSAWQPADRRGRAVG